MRHWKGIIGLVVAGFVLIIAGALIENLAAVPDDWAREVETDLERLGMAFLIAGLLAVLVDRPLKQEIARDALRYVMGWVSPERLRSELEWVYEEKFFAIEHRMTVDLAELPNGHTRMSLDIERKIRNESLRSQDFRPMFDVRDWHDPKRLSAVTEISASYRGTRCTEWEMLQTPDPDDLEATDLRRGQLNTTLTLAKDEEVTVFYRGYEDKLASDMHHEVLLTPTENPAVIVHHPSSLHVYVQFGSRGQKEHQRETLMGNRVESQWTLRGRMLPRQAVSIRWWPKAEQVTQYSE